MRSPPATGVRVCEKHQDFSDALGDRRIEEIQPPRFAGASPRKGHGLLALPYDGRRCETATRLRSIRLRRQTRLRILLLPRKTGLVCKRR
ncbi:TPA: hypothetical protein L6A07_19875 [Pseudomonas aeruginosa]|nr:hypothetical protein [Pseudomonas aeruginosa]